MKKVSKAFTLLLASTTLMTFLLYGCSAQKAEPSSSTNQSTKASSQSSDSKYDKVTLKLATIFNTDHSEYKGAVKLSELLKEKTGGAVKLDVYPNSQLGAEKDAFDMVVAGNIDMIATGYGLAAKRYAPAAIIDTGFIAKDRDHLMRILKSDAFKEISDGVLKTMGVRTIGSFYFGARQTTSKKEIKSLDDMKNVKLRAPENPTVMAAVKAMGAVPTPMALSEVYVALSQGVVDGQENPVAVIVSQKFYEVQKNLILTNHLVQPAFFLASDRVMSKLSPETQKVIEECAKEAADYTTKIAYQEEDDAMKTLQDKGMNIIKVDSNAFSEAASKVLLSDLAKQLGDDKLINKIKEVK